MQVSSVFHCKQMDSSLALDHYLTNERNADEPGARSLAGISDACGSRRVTRILDSLAWQAVNIHAWMWFGTSTAIRDSLMCTLESRDKYQFYWLLAGEWNSIRRRYLVSARSRPCLHAHG